MNNIKNFDEYFGRELEMEVLHNELNEKNKEGGLRGLVNRRKARKVRKQLEEEIEMSKNIVDGIKNGLDTLSNDFANLDKDLGNEKRSGGDKGKKLDDIKKIIARAKDTSWDINELIDDGEIDYAGFVGNVAIAKARYFGVFLFPVTTKVLVHKGYNYFFALVRNTIRKALVMLQLNFDQFENLIITKSLQGEDYQEYLNIARERQQAVDEVMNELVKQQHGNKKKERDVKAKFDAAIKKLNAQAREDKNIQSRRDQFGCLDQYNNTYTKSLETLRQYTQDDVQKHLDAIKTSMTKLTAGDVDLTAFAELIIAAAEEHAYKVSSTIYGRFAKMTEVFSLPNQAKLLKLIQDSTEEEDRERQRKMKEETDKLEKESNEEERKEIEDEGKKIFERFGGELKLAGEDYFYEVLKTGEWGDEDAYKYLLGDEKDSEEKRKLSGDEKKTMKVWFLAHPEVLEKCHESLRMLFPALEEFDDMDDYIDALTSVINDTLVEVEEEVDDEIIEDTLILNFDEYHLLVETKKKWDDVIENSKNLDDLLNSINNRGTKKRGLETKGSVKDLERVKNAVDKKYGSDDDKKPDWYKALVDLIKYINDVIDTRSKNRGEKRNVEGQMIPKNKPDDKRDEPEFPDSVKEQGVDKKDVEKIIGKSKKEINHYIDFKDIDGGRVDDVKKLFVEDDGKDMNVLAMVALKSIGENIIDYKEFVSRSKDIAVHIKDAVGGKKKIGKNEYDVLKTGINKLIDEREHDYPILNGQNKGDNKEEKSEK